MNNIKQTLEALNFTEQKNYFVRVEEEVLVEVIPITDCKILMRVEEVVRFSEPKITYIESWSLDEVKDVIKQIFWMYEDEEEE